MNPWLAFWTQPLATIRAQAETSPSRHMLLLATLHGLVVLSYLPFFYTSVAGFLMGCSLALALGSAIGWAVWQAKSWALFWLGAKFRGRANLDAVRCVVAWGFLPGIASAIVWESIVASGLIDPPVMALLVFFLFAGPGLWGVLVTARACAAQLGLGRTESASFATVAGVLLVAIGFLAMLAKGVILDLSGNLVDALTGLPSSS